MGFLLNWLLWRRAADKEQKKLDEVVKQLSESKVTAELAGKDPKLREALRTLGVKVPPRT